MMLLSSMLTTTLQAFPAEFFFHFDNTILLAKYVNLIFKMCVGVYMYEMYKHNFN